MSDTAMTTLNGKSALVTGSTSGIGKQIALALASAGCRIVLNGIDKPDVAQQTRLEVLAAGAPMVTVNSDNLLLPDAIKDIFQMISRQFGSLDILVNNAGIQHVSPIETFPDGEWDRIVELNLSVPFRLIKHALPGMRERGWGRIVNVASVHGLVGSVNKSAYVAAKHGLIGLTKAVALETSGDFITCNAICPGYVQTPMVDAQIKTLAKAENLGIDAATRLFLKEKQPSGAFVSSSDVGEMAVFLCSNTGAQITGSAFTIDGGWTAQ